MSLVPYTHSSPYPNWHQLPERHFYSLDRKKALVIKQNWKDDGRGGTAVGFGAVVYDAAIVLAEYLQSNDMEIKSKRVLELGCGTGYLALVAALCGAAKVVATDGDEGSVDLSMENINLNREAIGNTSIVATKLLWGERASVVDKEEYDVILGADIVACPYADTFAALRSTLLRLMRPKTVILLAYKRRYGKEEQDILDTLASDFQKEEVTNISQDFEQSGIHIIKLTTRS